MLGGVVEVVSSIPAVGHKIFFSIFGIFDLLYIKYAENAEKYFMTHRGNQTHDLDNTA